MRQQVDVDLRGVDLQATFEVAPPHVTPQRAVSAAFDAAQVKVDQAFGVHLVRRRDLIREYLSDRVGSGLCGPDPEDTRTRGTRHKIAQYVCAAAKSALQGHVHDPKLYK